VVIPDRHFAVQLHPFIPGFLSYLVAIFLKRQSDLSLAAVQLHHFIPGFLSYAAAVFLKRQSDLSLAAPALVLDRGDGALRPPCPGREPPCWAVKRPAPIHNRHSKPIYYSRMYYGRREGRLTAPGGPGQSTAAPAATGSSSTTLRSCSGLMRMGSGLRALAASDRTRISLVSVEFSAE
jgi:hypothetical protein